MAKTPRKGRALHVRLKHLPAFNTDQAAWEAFRRSRQQYQPQEMPIVKLTESWAQLMQAELRDGKTIEKIAAATLAEANHGSTPGLQRIHLSVALLQRFWLDTKAAQELQQWFVKTYMS